MLGRTFRLGPTGALLSLGLLATFGAAVPGGLMMTGCSTHVCDQQCVHIDSQGLAGPCGGAVGGTPSGYAPHLFDDQGELGWETASLDGPWLDYPGNRTWVIDFPPELQTGCPPSDVMPYISADNSGVPNASHSNWVNGAGQLDEYGSVSPTSISVTNATCAEYALRLVIHVPTVQSVTGSAPATPPPDDRCGVTPRMLVSASALVGASTFPVPPDAGTVTAEVPALVASASDLYFTASVVTANPGVANSSLGGSLMRVPLGGGSPTLVASAGQFVGRPVLTTTRLLAGARNTSGDAILSVPLAGGAPTTLVALGSGDSLLSGLAADDSFVYFGDSSGVEAFPLSPGSGTPSIVTLSTDSPDGLGIEPPVPDGGGLDAGLAVGPQLLFALSQGGVESVPLPPQAGALATTAAPSAAGFVHFFVCGSNTCWLETGGTIKVINPANGAVTTLASLKGALSRADDIVFDGIDFYVTWSDAANTRSLARIPAGGGCPTLVGTTSGGGGIAVDDECVYWSSSAGIFSLAKTVQGPFAQ